MYCSEYELVSNRKSATTKVQCITLNVDRTETCIDIADRDIIRSLIGINESSLDSPILYH